MPVTNFQSVISTQSLGTADVDKLAQSFDKLSSSIDGATAKSNKVNEHPGFASFAEKVKQGIENPLQAIGGAAEGMLKTLGPIGAGVATTGAIFVTAGLAGMSFARELGAFGDRIGDTAVRMGLSIKETGEFSFAMKRAGGDIGDLQGIMRKLSQGLSDSSEEGKKAREGMRDLGIATHDLQGHSLPMSQVIVQLSERLAGMTDTASRNSTAIKIMGRAALDVLPDLMELSDGVKRARELGFGPTEEDVKRWDKYRQQMAEVDAMWEKLKRQFKEPLAATVVVTLKWLTSGDKGGILGMASTAGTSKAPDMHGYGFEDLPLVADLLGNRGLYAPGYSPGLAPQVLSDSMAQSNAAKSLGAWLSTGLEGAKSKAEELKQKYEEARNTARSLADQTFVLPSVAAKAKDEVEKTWHAYQQQSDLVKELTKDEERRLSLLEKARDLIRQGQTFYQIGTGPLTTFTTGEQLFNANRPARGIPSLFGNAYNPYRETAAANANQIAPSYGAGLQVIDGEMVFVSPSSQRGNLPGETEQLTARGAGQVGLQSRLDAARLSSLRSETEQTARLIELRTGPGGEGQAARMTREIREQGLQRELELTGDIIKYREDSQRNQLDFELKVAELQRQRLDRLRSESGQFFDAMLGGGKGIENFAKNTALGYGRTIFSNVATDIFSGQSLNRANVLGGTPFGPDPLKDATMQNTMATVDNTTALRALRMSAMSASGGGGGFSPASASMFSRLFTGGGSAPGTTGSGETDSESWGLPSGQNGDFGGEVSHSLGLGQGLGIGAAALGGGFGIYSGIRSGGARGGLTAAGSGLAMAGSIMALASKSLSALGPIGMIAGMGLGMITSLLGDPKQERASQMQQDAQARAYSIPSGWDYSADNYGRAVNSDFMGRSRPIVVNQYNQISAVDGPSLEQHLINNPTALSKGIVHAVTSGNGEDIVGTLRNVM